MKEREMASGDVGPVQLGIINCSVRTFPKFVYLRYRYITNNKFIIVRPGITATHVYLCSKKGKLTEINNDTKKINKAVIR